MVALTTLVAPISSIVGDGNFYIKGNLGIGMPLDSDVDNLPDVARSAGMTFDTEFIGFLAAGYDFANPFRMEIISLIRKNDLMLGLRYTF